MRVLAAILLSAVLASCTASSGPRERYGRFVQQTADPGAVAAADLRMARMARDEGVLAALRTFAADDAQVFAPTPMAASDYLKSAQDFPSTRWAPHRVLSSCDGSLAVTIGAIEWGETAGHYYTVWARDRADRRAEYRWILSDGDGVAEPLTSPEAISTKTASCEGSPPVSTMPQADPRYGGRALSADRSLRYEWWAMRDGSRQIIIEMWNGTDYEGIYQQSVQPRS